MESERSRIFRCGDWSIGSQDAKEKGRGSAKLASAKKHKKGTKVPRACQLLQAVH